MAFTTKSTGTHSAIQLGLTWAVRNKPHPVPATIPDGPLMLSIHPGMGSSATAVTASEMKLRKDEMF